MTAALVNKYFDTSAGAAVFSGGTEVTPLRDGVEYFDALDTAINATTGAGDAIYVLAWRLDASLDLRSRSGAAAKPIGQVLAMKAAAGVDVRLVLWTGYIMGDPGTLPIANPCQDNFRAAQSLRTQTVPGTTTPPLANRVLLDWSGSPTGSHHMKSVLVISGGGADMIGFATGLDPWKYRRDQAPHTTIIDPADQTPFGWHDMAIRVRGIAARGIYDTFAERWNEAASLPPRTVVSAFIGPVDPTKPREPFNPPSPPALPSPSPAAPVVVEPQRAVQILRSRWDFKEWHWWKAKGSPWAGPPGATGAFREVFATLKKAILNATDYIYVEDQYLGEKPSGRPPAIAYSLFPHLLSVATTRNVKLIFVGSGRGDPDDPPWERGPKNVTFETAGDIKTRITDPLSAAGVDPRQRVAVWRLKPATVHSKIWIIDDRFLSIGSANMFFRSMYGEDSELQAAVVDEGEGIRDFRISLWCEHFNIPQTGRPPGVELALRDIPTAVGLWRSTWLPPASGGAWTTPDNPPGFVPAPNQIQFVGPA
jgi:phosphatidylserine/phosphatidylglycerophosphate/cardiolipin synthase-like enzyme